MKSASRWLVCCAVFFTCSGQVVAGKLEKGFDALALHDYFKARTLFQSQTGKHPSAAWYGLSVISARADNPFYQLDSAYTFIQKADAAFTGAPDKERVFVKQFGVDHDAIVAQRTLIGDAAWDLTTKVNTIAAYERYMATFLFSVHAGEAKLVRDHLAYQEARSVNSSLAYASFIERYPDARQVHEARTRLQGSVFRENTLDGSIESYERFMVEHPESPYLKNAEDEIYRLSVPHGTGAEYHAFIKRYPMNARVPDAWRTLYASSTRDLSAASITEFLKTYPDYPFIEELAADFKIASMRLLPFRKDSLWGFIDDTGTERIKAVYTWVEAFVKDQALVERNGLVGTINKQGGEVVAVQYDDVQDGGQGLYIVERNERMGVCDRKGSVVVAMEYDEIGDFVDGLAYAAKDDRYGFIKPDGTVAIPFAFDNASTFQGGLAVVERFGRAGAINAKGDSVVACQFDRVEGYAEGISRVWLNGKVGLIGPFGEVILAAEHDHIGAFKSGLALVVDGAKCGYVDRKGRFAIAQKYEAVEGVNTWGDFRNDHAEVRLKGKHGAITATGSTLLPCEYADIGGYTSWGIAVKKKTKWAFVDRNAKAITEAKYDQAWDFENGVARVSVGGVFLLVDSTGKELMKAGFQQLTPVGQGYFMATTAEGTGLISPSGVVVVPCTYASLTLLEMGVVKVERNQRFAYIRLPEVKTIWKEEGFDAAR
ncbi:MAG: WG repeat-containing protein [Flavobacteriales bacterium]|nr:WG repeat-containing protein [Flavobacteriales bacterium]